MPVTNYHTVNGRIRGETTDGVQTNYLCDALGSVVATTDSTATILDTFRYKPYGMLLSATSADSKVRFQWIGSRGYRYLNRHEHYVRGRHLVPTIASWTTIDRFWPAFQAYVYASSSPTVFTDPTGQFITVDECDCTKCVGSIPMHVPPLYPFQPRVDDICRRARKCWKSSRCRENLAQCIKGCCYDSPDSILAGIVTGCNSPTYEIHIECSWDIKCLLPICAHSGGGTDRCNIEICSTLSRKNCDCLPGGGSYYERCRWPSCAADPDQPSLTNTILHEMAHCAGYGGDTECNGKSVGNCIADCFESNA
jgi:RHS repeat-associated protein